MHAGDVGHGAVLTGKPLAYIGNLMRQHVKIVAGLWALSAPLLAQDPLHRRYTKADGLPSNTVYTALQDKQGFMWFGTESGAVRFDGHEFRNYGLEDGLTDNSVIGMGEDSKGRIWFLMLNGKLCFWANDTIWNQALIPELGKYVSSTGWQSFAEDAQGCLWFGGVRGDALRLDLAGDHDRMWHFKTGFMVSVVADSSGEVRSLLSGRITRLERDEWVIGDSLPTGFINACALPGADHRSPPLGLAPEGIMAAVGRKWVPLLRRALNPAAHRAFIDGAGDLWLTYIDGGIEQHARTTAGFGPPRRLFPEEVINFAYVDREGDRWLTTARHGIIRCTSGQFNTALYRTGGSVASEALLSIGRVGGSTITGSAEGSIYRSGRDGLVRLRTMDLGRVLNIATDTQGDAWAACDNTLLLLDHGAGRIKHIGGMGLLGAVTPTTGAKTVSVGPDGTVWSSSFGVYRVTPHGPTGERVRILIADSLNLNERILALLADRQGRVWFASNAELHCLERERRIDLGDLQGRTGLRISCLVEWTGDTLLIGTVGSGVLLFHEGRIVGTWSAPGELSSNEVGRIRVIGDTVVVVTGADIAVHTGTFAKQGGGNAWFTLGSDLVDEVNDVMIDRGDLLLATGGGLCRMPFPQRPGSSDPPRPYFAGCWLNDAQVSVIAPIRMLEGSDRLRVSFRAIAFADPEGVRYQYRLDKGDAWSDSKDGILSLASVKSGIYRLEARASNSRSDWSTPLLLQVEVVGRWWNRPIALLGFLFLLAAVIFLGYWLFLRRKYRGELDQLRRQEAVNEERRRIAADVHDDLGADLSRLLLHARHAEAGGEQASAKVTAGLSASIEKIDEIIWSLDPRRDTLRSTVQFIEQQVREVAEANGLLFRTTVEMPEAEVPMDADRRRELLLIAREAVRNVVEHAQATTLRLEWKVDRRSIRMRIEDDGIGFDPGRPVERHGLGNMKKRANDLGGTMLIGPHSPQGTVVLVEIPVPRNHPIG